MTEQDIARGITAAQYKNFVFILVSVLSHLTREDVLRLDFIALAAIHIFNMDAHHEES